MSAVVDLTTATHPLETVSHRNSLVPGLDFNDPLLCAVYIKNTINRSFYAIEDFESISEWYKMPRNGGTRKIHYTSIADKADRELKEWLNVPYDVKFMSNFDINIKQWINTLTVNDLVGIISLFPTFFSPWQRLFCYYICEHPISYTVSMEVDLNHLNQRNDTMNRKKRKIEIASSFSSVANVPQRINILALATASGKTSISIAISNYLVTKGFQNMKARYVHKCSGIPFRGLEHPVVAPIVLVCSSGGVHSHWINEFERLVDKFTAIHPAEYNVWDGQSKNYSVKQAFDDYNARGFITFWFLQIGKVNEELRKFPHIAVAVVVTDEMTIDTPREKSKTAQSDVCVRLLPQATPQALVKASRGCTSWLKEAFDGELNEIAWVPRTLRRGCYKDTQLTIDQYCKMMQFMPLFFRNQIRLDLQPYIPVGKEIYYVKSRRGTLAAHLANSTADIVPASFVNVLRSNIPYYNYDYEASGLKELDTRLNNDSSIKIEEIIHSFDTIVSKFGKKLSEETNVSRMIERMREFCQECPICCSETEDVKMMTCCSYCVCSRCYGGFHRCAFCRTPISDQVTIESPEVSDSFEVKESLKDTIYDNISERNLQMKNLSIVLRSMSAHGYKRILLMVDIYDLTRDRTSAFMNSVQEDLNMKVYETERATNGKGTAFKEIKNRFDNLEAYPDPMVLLCSNSRHSSVLVGVDFKYTDAVIFVGDIVQELATQLMGRVFRPLISRDNTKYIPFVRVYS